MKVNQIVFNKNSRTLSPNNIQKFKLQSILIIGNLEYNKNQLVGKENTWRDSSHGGVNRSYRRI